MLERLRNRNQEVPHQETVSTQAELRSQNPEVGIQDEEMNKESALS